MPKKKFNHPKLYQAVISILSLLLAYFGFKNYRLSQIEPATTYTVHNVLDGDTFVVEDYNQRIRLYGVEAPELKYHFGEESKQYLESLILNQDVYFKNIVADKYGRIIALVYLDDQLINETLIKNGYVDHDGRQIPGDNPDLLQDAEDFAKQEKLGIFGPESTQTENPDNPNCTIKGNIRRGKKTYLFPVCRSYNLTIIEKHKGDQWFCNEADAKKAGFTKPTACFGKSFKPND